MPRALLWSVLMNLQKEADELNERSKELNTELTELEARSEVIKEEKIKN